MYGTVTDTKHSLIDVCLYIETQDNIYTKHKIAQAWSRHDPEHISFGCGS